MHPELTWPGGRDRPLTEADRTGAARFLQSELHRLHLLKHGRWGKPHARHFWVDASDPEDVRVKCVGEQPVSASKKALTLAVVCCSDQMGH